jgi:Superfamily II DNA/RNA helicases, SNF2 family
MFVTADTNHFVVPWRQDLAAVIPHARALDHGGQRMLVIPNRKEEARLARNLGLPVPAPVLTRFNWCGLKPWDVQRSTAALLTESQRCYVLSELGTGKTLASIFSAEYLRQTGEVKRVLITAPLSVLTPVWEKEIFLANPQARVKVLHSDKRVRRLQLLAEDADYYVINHHGLPLLRDELIAKKFDLFIIDELATFRTQKTDLWRSAKAIVDGIKYVWGMTGSPRPKAPTDAWGQARLLTPERTTRTFTRFRDLTMMQVSQFKWAERQGANDIVFDAMQPSVRYTLSDVVELPPTVTLDHKVASEPKAKQAYQLMVTKLRMMSERGEITAANEGVLQSKLLQVACGFMYTNDKAVYTLPNKPRMEALRDFCRASNSKVIVFVPFVHALQSIADYLRKEGETVEMVYGGTSKTSRDRIFADFQNSPSPRVLVAHPQCMAHGLTLTAASTIVWYTATNNPEHYEQANGRIRRPGQKEKQLIVHLTGTPVERVAYSRLKTRGRMQGLLLELFHQQELEV